MTIQDLGAIGEFFGLFAILITLFYLARQTSQNAEIGRATEQRTVIDQFNVYYRIMTESSKLPIVRNGFVSYNNLNSDDQAVAFGIFAQWINYYEQCMYSHDGGLFPKAALDAIGNWVISILVTPGGREYWELYGASFGIDIRNAINEILADTNNLPEPITTVYSFLAIEDTDSTSL